MLDHLRITLVAVGRCKQGPERDLFDHYMRRLSGKLTLKEVEDKSSGPAAKKCEREGALLLAALPKGAKMVALDERGRQVTSRDFAKLLGQWRDAGEQDIAFVIGGADGLSEELRTRADKLISFRRGHLAPPSGARPAGRTALPGPVDPKRPPLSPGLKSTDEEPPG